MSILLLVLFAAQATGAHTLLTNGRCIVSCADDDTSGNCDSGCGDCVCCGHAASIISSVLTLGAPLAHVLRAPERAPRGMLDAPIDEILRVPIAALS